MIEMPYIAPFMSCVQVFINLLHSTSWSYARSWVWRIVFSVNLCRHHSGFPSGEKISRHANVQLEVALHSTILNHNEEETQLNYVILTSKRDSLRLPQLLENCMFPRFQKRFSSQAEYAYGSRFFSTPTDVMLALVCSH